MYFRSENREWKVEDESIAKIDNGKIKGIKKGRTNVYVQLGDYILTREAVSEGLSIAGRHKSGKHGYGLDNVRRCVDKYKGTMKLTCDDGKFVAEILVYVSTIK